MSHKRETWRLVHHIVALTATAQILPEAKWEAAWGKKIGNDSFFGKTLKTRNLSEEQIPSPPPPLSCRRTHCLSVCLSDHLRRILPNSRLPVNFTKRKCEMNTEFLLQAKMSEEPLRKSNIFLTFGSCRTIYCTSFAKPFFSWSNFTPGFEV